MRKSDIPGMKDSHLTGRSANRTALVKTCVKKSKQIKSIIIVLLLFNGLTSCWGQTKSSREEQELQPETTFEVSNTIQVEIHSRVDTTKIEIKEIATLWTNYLNSEPEKITDNPHWNEEEKKLYKDFDLSRNLLYQLPSGQLLSYFKPVILSIEREGDNYGIRTLYIAEGLEGEYRKSNPWAIQKVYAIKENNQWRLKNALPVLTENWNRCTVGKITFIYPPHHEFNMELAKKANEFCNHVRDEFGFADWEPFDFYITQSGDELGQLVNFDFFFAGYTTGIGMNEKRILMSGLGSEYYPHEFIHLIVPKFDRHDIIEEGFATWQGGVAGKAFEESARLVANEWAKDDTVSFLDILNRNWGTQYAAYYTRAQFYATQPMKRVEWAF